MCSSHSTSVVASCRRAPWNLWVYRTQFNNTVRDDSLSWTAKQIQHHAKSLQSYLTLCDTMNYSLSDPSVHGVLQARILEWVAVSSSRGSS